MSTTDKPNVLEQRIIVYTPLVQKGEITQGEVPYSNAYTDEQVRDGVMNCVLRPTGRPECAPWKPGRSRRHGMGKRRTRRLYLAAADAYQAGVLYAAGAHHNPPAVTGRALYDILWTVYQQGHEDALAGKVTPARRLPLKVWQRVLADATADWALGR